MTAAYDVVQGRHGATARMGAAIVLFPGEVGQDERGAILDELDVVDPMLATHVVLTDTPAPDDVPRVWIRLDVLTEFFSAWEGRALPHGGERLRRAVDAMQGRDRG